MMCECQYENPAEFYEAKTVKARKTHRCCECLRTIDAGERYERVVGRWRETGFDEFHTCDLCLAARVAMKLKCWMFGYLDEIIDGDHKEPEALALVARRRVNYDRIQAEKAKRC